MGSMDGLKGLVARVLASGGTRRQMLATALAGLILGLGSVTVGTSLVQASERDGLAGFFEMLFGGPRHAVVAPPRQPGRYANLPEPRLHRAPRPHLYTPRPRAEPAAPADRRWTRRPRRETVAAAPAGPGGQTVCVRMCDGYMFPLGTLRSRADMPVHRAACAAACPNAATSVYTLAAGETELDRAVSPQGMPYRASALANVYRQRLVQNCSCQAKGAATHLPLAEDMTLRQGDVVATAGSAGVVTRMRTGRVELTDFRRARLTRGQTRQIEARVGTLRRDEQARSFRRLMRTADRSEVVRVAGVGAGFREPERAAAEDGAAPVRVVAPSPFR
jgi:hypothetical protein